MKWLNMFKFISFTLTLIFSLVLAGCNVVNNTSSLVTINTYDYDPGNKTGINISIGNSAPIKAEIDTGSDMTVVNESAIESADIIKTTESMSMIYGGGENTVSGYLAYGSVTFTTNNGTTISSAKNTPLLIVTNGSVNEGGGNNAILGMRMNNQVSVRLYLPAPYNNMMILNRPNNQLIFGQLNSTQLNNFANIQQMQVSCVNYNVPVMLKNTCWDVAANSVSYTYTESGIKNTTTYPTIFDSGEANASFYFSPAPSWMAYDNHDVITTPLTVAANTDKGPIELPLTGNVYYRNIPTSTVNPGNNLFNSYQVLFDQVDGIIGFQNYNNPL